MPEKNLSADYISRHEDAKDFVTKEFADSYCCPCFRICSLQLFLLKDVLNGRY